MMVHLDRYILNARVLPMSWSPSPSSSPLSVASGRCVRKDGLWATPSSGATTGASSAFLATVPVDRARARSAPGWRGAALARVGRRASHSYLRYAHPELDERQSAALHAKIAKLDPGLHVPPKAEEEADPAAAAKCYGEHGADEAHPTWGPKNYPCSSTRTSATGFDATCWHPAHRHPRLP